MERFKVGKYRLAERSGLEIVITAAFIAIVSFGALTGVLAATAPRTFFGLAEGIVCARDEDISFDEWFDGESTQFRVYCINPAKGETHDRTVAALAVVLGGFYLVIFWAVWLVLIIIRAFQKAKLAAPPQIPSQR